ncbi:MAG: NTP transferase domain-containing protein, partial [Oscillospiraceae bacterium]|nr:NTP transferase domain-containing protein [Oscillospiraceae bacterium]
MKCLILAAGYATRLYPLTENFPKPLLDVRGKKILEWLIEDLGDLEYVVVTNHRFAPIFREWADTRAEKITVVDDGTSTNETRLGAVCDMQFAIRQAGVEDDLLVLAGDNVLDFSQRSFLTYAAAKGTSCTMRYR